MMMDEIHLTNGSCFTSVTLWTWNANANANEDCRCSDGLWFILNWQQTSWRKLHLVPDYWTTKQPVSLAVALAGHLASHCSASDRLRPLDRAVLQVVQLVLLKYC